MLQRFRARIEQRGVVGALRYGALSRTLRALNALPATDRTDRLYALVDFVRKNGRRPTNRPLFNDVLYRMKVGGELADPIRVRTTDKVLVKRYIADEVGERYHVPTLAVLSTEREVRTFDYPERCAIKPAHGTGRKLLRTHGEPVDTAAVAGWLTYDQYLASREVNYRGLDRRVIVEPLLDGAAELSVTCYRGHARLIYHRSPPRRLFTPTWSDLRCTYNTPLAGPLEPVEPPPNLAEIVRISEALARAFSLVRVDLYAGLPGGVFAVGELTHCPSSAGRWYASEEHHAYISSLVFTERPTDEPAPQPP